MRKNKGSASSVAPSVVLATLLLLLVGSTLYIFLDKVWWFPKAITPVGHLIDRQFDVTLAAMGVVFVLSQVGLAWAVIRYRDRGQAARFSRGNNTLEVLWTLATATLFVGLGAMAKDAWGRVHFLGAAPGALQIEVTGMQFQWQFRYPGPDGKFGRTDPTLVSASTGNPLGLDFNDPAAKDDIVVPTLTVPVNRQVELVLHSQDVIHSFFVRELRMKQDAVPGMTIPIHFTPTQVGQYEIACAELCGLGHYRMRSVMNVVPEAEYDNWLKQQEALIAQSQ